MVKLFGRLFDSFISAVAYCFLHNQDYGVKRPKHNRRRISKSNRPLSLQTVELKVRMCCTGCKRLVKETIHRLKGVDSVVVELELEKVTIIGHVDRNKVLKAVRRAGKRAEFWPYPNPPLYFTSSNQYFKDVKSEYKKSYNYWRHGYNEADKHGSLHITHRGDDMISNMFNDDNVNGCSVM